MLFVLWCLPVTSKTMRRHNICNVLMLLRDVTSITGTLLMEAERFPAYAASRHRIVSYPIGGYFHIHCPEDRESENSNCFPPLTKMSDGKTNKYKHTNMLKYYARKTLQFVNKHTNATTNTDT
jgi:hypothetical protein